jgi:hypothetical protein
MVMIAHAQGQYAPEPVREYDPGDYLPPLYNAIKRSIQGAIDVLLSLFLLLKTTRSSITRLSVRALIQSCTRWAARKDQLVM